MRAIGLGALLLAALTTVAAGQQPTAADEDRTGVGRELDLRFPIADLVGREQDMSFSGQILELRWAILDLEGKVSDLQFAVADLGGKPKDLQVKETKTEIHIDLAADVLFDFDKATLRPEAREALKEAASVIRDNARGTVRIEGHTDAKGSDAYNQKLSEQRAKAVRDWLVSKEGLKSIKFSTQGFGAKRPVAPNTKPNGADDPEGRQKNRRVEIIVAKR